jgi:hypothetical protein
MAFDRDNAENGSYGRFAGDKRQNCTDLDRTAPLRFPHVVGGLLMARRPAMITQKEVARLVKGACEGGMNRVRMIIQPGGVLTVDMSRETQAAEVVPGSDDWSDVNWASRKAKA